MTASHFSVSHFEKKLSQLKDTQESIQGLSTWCLNHKSDIDQIIKCWLKAVKKAKIDQSLTLFYLANDVIQHSKKKQFLFIVTGFEHALLEATPFVSKDEKVSARVQRIFKIWEDREIYSSSFIAELNLLLKPSSVEISHIEMEVKPPTKLQTDFEAITLIEKIRHCKSLEEETDLKQKILNESKVKITEVDSLRASVKERRKTDDFFNEFDASVKRMEDYVQALEAETKERATLINLLEQGDLFYEMQRGEFKVVCLAYKNFGSRVKGVKRKLEDIVSNLSQLREPKRIESPVVDASSPGASSPGTDIELPDAFSLPVEKTTQQLGMDLDSRITSFLATGSQTLAASFMANPVDVNVTNAPRTSKNIPAQTDPFPFYPRANGPFGDLSSLLVAPPPPPPPPPPTLKSGTVLNDSMTRINPTTLPQVGVLDTESWGQSSANQNTLPSGIPPWALEVSNNDGSNQISSHHSVPFFSNQDVDLRGSKRPIDHRNLISLTSGPDKYSPPMPETHNLSHIDEEDISTYLKDVRQAYEARERSAKHNDLNEQVINLLDSFDRNQMDGNRSQPHQHASASTTALIQNVADPNLHRGHLTGMPVVNKGNGTLKSEAKVPSLMATLLYPDQPPFTSFETNNSSARMHYDPHLMLPRGSGIGGGPPPYNPSNMGYSPSRFTRPPPRGPPRW